MNTITVVGNLTRDPEVRFTTSGLAITRFGIAVNQRRKKGDEWVETTSFFDVTAFGELGQNVADECKKGRRVIVTGRLEQETWEKDGEKRSAVRIIADEIGTSLRFVGERKAKPTYDDSEPF